MRELQMPACNPVHPSHRFQQASTRHLMADREHLRFVEASLDMLAASIAGRGVRSVAYSSRAKLGNWSTSGEFVGRPMVLFLPESDWVTLGSPADCDF